MKNFVANKFKYCRVEKGKDREREEEKNLWRLFGGEGESERCSEVTTGEYGEYLVKK